MWEKDDESFESQESNAEAILNNEQPTKENNINTNDEEEINTDSKENNINTNIDGDEDINTDSKTLTLFEVYDIMENKDIKEPADQMDAMSKLLPLMKNLDGMIEYEKKYQQKIAGYLTDTLEKLESARENGKFSYQDLEQYSALKTSMHAIPQNTAFQQEILHRMLKGFADDTYKYVMDHQQEYTIDKWNEKKPGEIVYLGFPEISKDHLKTYNRYEKMLDMVVFTQNQKDRLYSTQDIPEYPSKPEATGDEEIDQKAKEAYQASADLYQKEVQKKIDIIHKDEKLYTALRYAVGGPADRNEITVPTLRKLGQGRLLQPYIKSMALMKLLFTMPEFKKPENQNEDFYYANPLINLSWRLERTKEGLFYSESNDSPQFRDLLTTCTELANRKKNAELNGEPYTYKDFKNLNKKVDKYFEHCEIDKRGDSRRKERKKIAQRIKWICQAYSHGAKPEEYLKDIIAENYYEGIVELSKLDKKAKQDGKLFDPVHKRKVIDGYIKKSAGFQSMMAKVHDITDLYHLCENKTKTFDKMLSINSKQDSKQIQSDPKIQAKTKKTEKHM